MYQYHGRITLDGVDILSLPAQLLRSRLAIIPQVSLKVFRLLLMLSLLLLLLQLLQLLDNHTQSQPKRVYFASSATTVATSRNRSCSTERFAKILTLPVSARTPICGKPFDAPG